MCSGRVSRSCSTSGTHCHLLHRTAYTYSQNATDSIMLPQSFSIFNFAYIHLSTQEIVEFQIALTYCLSTINKIQPIFSLRKHQQIRRYLSVLFLWYCHVYEPELQSCILTFTGHPFFRQIVRPRWPNELGSWITQQLIQAYHQYGVGLRPAL